MSSIKTLILSSTTFFTVAASAQQSLTIDVSNIQNVNGSVMVAVFNDAQNYSQESNPFLSYTQRVTGSHAQSIWPNLPSGEYAIMLFQDINNNQKLDTGDNGAPIEPVGFSNDNGEYRMLRFDETKFDLKEDKKITIKLR